jgi:hypothetical protein
VLQSYEGQSEASHGGSWGWPPRNGRLLPITLSQFAALDVQSSYFLGDPPPDPRFLAPLGALPSVTCYNHTRARAKRAMGGLGGWPPRNDRFTSYNLTLSRFAARDVQSSYFLGDPPPGPRFLASLGALPSVTVNLLQSYESPSEASHRGSGGLAPQERPITSYNVISVRSPGCSVIVLPGGSYPQI